MATLLVITPSKEFLDTNKDIGNDANDEVSLNNKNRGTSNHHGVLKGHEIPPTSTINENTDQNEDLTQQKENTVSTEHNVSDIYYLESERTGQQLDQIPKNPPQKSREKNHSSPKERVISIVSLKDKFEEGYNINGDIEPFLDAIEIEGKQYFEEDEMPEVDSSTDTEVSSSSDVQLSPLLLITIEDIKKMKIPELKEELKKRNLALSGKKPVLSKRLEGVILNKMPVGTADKTKPIKPKKDTSKIKGFCEGAHWEVLNPEADAVTEPNNTSFCAPHAPTI